MAMVDIQSLFQDIIETPRQRQQAMQAQGQREAQIATNALSGRSQIFAPLVSQLAASQGSRDEMLQRSVGGLFGLDTRNESEKLQQMLSQADTSTPEGVAALSGQLRQMGMPDKALQLEQQAAAQAKAAEAAAFTQDIQSRQVAATEGNLALNREQQQAALAAAQAEQARLRVEREANLASSLDLINGAKGLKPEDAATITSMVTRSGGAIPIPQVQATIKAYGGFPDEGGKAANLQFRTGEVVGEEDKGLQSFILDPSTGSITRTIENPDGTTTEERLPSNRVRFISSTRDAPASTFEPSSRTTTTGRQTPLFELVGSATGIGSTLKGLYNESPLADLFGTDEKVAEAQARFAGFENKIMELYSTRSRPSNWSEQRILRLMPKVGTIFESEGSAEAKLVVLGRSILDQYDYEIQQYQANAGNPTRQQAHFDNIQDFGRLLDDFGTIPGDKETLPVPTTRAEIESLPDGAQFWLDGNVHTWTNGQIIRGQ